MKSKILRGVYWPSMTLHIVFLKFDFASNFHNWKECLLKILKMCERLSLRLLKNEITLYADTDNLLQSQQTGLVLTTKP